MSILNRLELSETTAVVGEIRVIWGCMLVAKVANVVADPVACAVMRMGQLQNEHAPHREQLVLAMPL